MIIMVCVPLKIYHQSISLSHDEMRFGILDVMGFDASTIKKRINRLDFLVILIKGSFLALLSVTVYPIIRFLIPPKTGVPTDTSVVAAKITDIPLNAAKIFPFGNKPAILIRTADNVFKAFTAVCTHLDCTVQFDQQSGVILCACHDGRYGLNGQVISGPPPRPLEEYKVILRDDDIIVSRV